MFDAPLLVLVLATAPGAGRSVPPAILERIPAMPVPGPRGIPEPPPIPGASGEDPSPEILPGVQDPTGDIQEARRPVPD